MLSIDIIVPVYNPEGYLEEALSSAILQTYKGSYQIIVVDDGSTEEIAPIIAAVQKKWGRKNVTISLIFSHENRGAAYARNLGIQNSASDLIFFHDADDVMHEKRLLITLKHFQRDPKLMLACGNFQRIVNNFINPIPKFLQPPKLSSEMALQQWPIACGSVAIRRKALQQTGLFKEDYEIGEDYDLWLRFFQQFPGQMKYIHEVLYYYRYQATEASLTKRFAGTARHLDIYMELQKKYG